MKKRFLSLALALILTLVPMAASVSAEDDPYNFEYSYYEENGFKIEVCTQYGELFSVTVLDYDGPGGEVVIPDGVTEIRSGLELFVESNIINGAITSIIMPESMVHIRSCDGLPNLTSVTILNGNANIWDFEIPPFTGGIITAFEGSAADLTIYSIAGGAVEEYANKHGINFAAISADNGSQAFNHQNIINAISDYYENAGDSDTKPNYVVQYDLDKDGINEFIATVDRWGAEYGILIYGQNNTLRTYEFDDISGQFFISSTGYLCREYGDGVNINLYIWEFTPDKITEHKLFANNEFDADGDYTGNLVNCKYNDMPQTEKEFWDIAGQFGVFNDDKEENYLSNMENIKDSLLAPAPTQQTAAPTASTVLVNGADTAFDAYLIGGNNYFKLRDLAYVLNGTEKQFNVGWDGDADAITLTSGEAYTPVGGELEPSIVTGDRDADPTTSAIYLDGELADFTAYLIGGNNYFRLRDVMQAFDVYVGWDGATSTITLDTSRGYEN